MWVQYDKSGYQGDNNLRSIIRISGEAVTGTEVVKITISTPIDVKSNHLFNVASGQIVEKTLLQKKNEKLKYYQSKILNDLQIINVAIASQEASNRIRRASALPEVTTITEQEITDAGNYQNTVATFDETWDPNAFTLEQIDENIFNGGYMPPAVIRKFLL